MICPKGTILIFACGQGLTNVSLKRSKNCGEVSAGVEAKTELQSMFLKDRVRHASGTRHSIPGLRRGLPTSHRTFS